jgi:cytochrome c-type biogenesis protein CcmH/NrfG
MNAALTFPRIFVMGALGLSLAVMLCLSGANFLAKPLSTETRGRGMTADSEAAQPDFALSEEHMADISELMAKLKDNPNDAETLLSLGDLFIRAREWTRAESFLQRAVLANPSDIRPRYMLGIALYQQGKMELAIKTFENVILLDEDPATMYNLGVIYKYQLANPKRAEELFRKTVESPKADAEIRAKAQKELAP